MPSKVIQEIMLGVITFISLDAIFFGLLTFPHFNKVVKDIQGSPLIPNIFTATIAYITTLSGLYYFVIDKIEKKFNIKNILSLSIPYAIAVFGAVDFVNPTLFTNWTLKTSMINLFWGISNCTITTISVAYLRETYNTEKKEEFNKRKQ